ncbi:MAG: hypothetical protein EXR06_02075 [Rickettsiales bacterium]|nr:hypothetical protein [Rickettsiales bacterium]
MISGFAITFALAFGAFLAKFFAAPLAEFFARSFDATAFLATIFFAIILALGKIFATTLAFDLTDATAFLVFFTTALETFFTCFNAAFLAASFLTLRSKVFEAVIFLLAFLLIRRAKFLIFFMRVTIFFFIVVFC